MRLGLAIIGILVTFSAARAAPAEKPAIDVVFCIDCSGSMGPVIETAKQKVWAIVNEIARAKPAPVLRIGLIGYGNGEGPFRTFDLSSDLDQVYENLMTFQDEGWGSEFVGLAIHRATNDLKWADGQQVLRVIYVVGNETARQGPAEFDYTVAAPAALAKDIVVNAIYCGDVDFATAKPTWQELARLADGEYMEIAAHGGAIAIATPFDDELIKLNTAVNATYLGYGRAASSAALRQVQQDQNAMSLGVSVMAERTVAKSAVQYANASWDLCDAVQQEDFDIATLKDEELPEPVRNLPAEERLAFIEKTIAERDQLRGQIQEIGQKRQEFIREEIRKQGLSGDQSFDEAVRRSVIEQAKRKGFEFEQD